MTKRRRIDPAERPAGLTHNPFAALRPDGAAAPASAAPADAAHAVSTGAADAGAAASPRGKVVVRREKKGRGGKTVTRVSGLGLDGPALDDVARRLKRALGSGATVEGDEILVQGALVERVRTWLADELGRDAVAGN